MEQTTIENEDGPHLSTIAWVMRTCAASSFGSSMSTLAATTSTAESACTWWWKLVVAGFMRAQINVWAWCAHQAGIADEGGQQVGSPRHAHQGRVDPAG